MPTFATREELARWYEEAAYNYSARLTNENLMEAIPQGTQRRITLASFDLVHAHRPDVQAFNELLIQYRLGEVDRPRPYQVVPDNTVVVWDEPIEAVGSYDIELQPTGPFWVLEYVSKGSRRKDYEQNFYRYERQLKVPYYLTFYPDNQELTLHRHNGERYVTVLPNGNGRHAIPELDLEVALLDGWVRYWYRGELLLLPAELQRDLDEVRRQAAEIARRAEEADHRAADADRRATEADRRAAAEREARLAGEEELRRLRDELNALRRQQGPGAGETGE